MHLLIIIPPPPKKKKQKKTLMNFFIGNSLIPDYLWVNLSLIFFFKKYMISFLYQINNRIWNTKWYHHGVATALILLTFICPYQPLLLVSLLDGIQCMYWADHCKFLLVNQHWWRECYTSLSLLLQQFLAYLVCLGWFTKCVASGYIWLLFYRMPFPVFVQNSMQHYCIALL